MKKSKFIAINAMSLALIVLFTFVPINLGFAKLGIMILPVIISSQLLGWKSAVLNSFAMGLLSFISNTITPSSIMSMLMRNPLVSILPRMFIGLAVCGVYALTSKLLKKSKRQAREAVASIFASISGVLTNTGLVLLMTFILYFGKNIEGTAINGQFMMGLISINFVIELAISAFLVPPIVYALKTALKLGSKTKTKDLKINETTKISTEDSQVKDKTYSSQAEISNDKNDYKDNILK